MYTINDLKKTIGKNSIASVSKFSVDINIPIILRASSFVNNVIQSIPIIGKRINNGGVTSVPDNFNVMVKSTTLPDVSINTTDIWHRGHKYVVRSTADFSHKWDITFYNTANLELRSFFEGWMYEIDRYDAVLTTTSFPNNYLGIGELSSGYMSNIKVYQHCSDGTKSAGYELYYAFPSAISATNLDASTPNEISTFTVTFTYSYKIPVTPDFINI